jgi:ribosomal protein S18 acetylase RimI-like enzyme
MQQLAREDNLLQRLEIGEEPIGNLAEYGTISIAFDIEQVLTASLVDQGLGGILLCAMPVESSSQKDYDRIPGNAPADWSNRFDVASWGLIAARLKGELVGGAVVVHDSADVSMLERRRDLAVIWDLRVTRDFRRYGIGSAVWQAVENWAALRACRQLKVETQNTNVGACKFYVRRGCRLGAVNRFAYSEFPDEVQLLWYKDLRPDE